MVPERSEQLILKPEKVSTILLEEHVGRLRVAEECCCRDKAVTDDIERLLLKEEKSEARRCHQHRSKERSSEGSDKERSPCCGVDDINAPPTALP